ncbi:uncharacterized protein LOC117218249 [Megalopta genalis]|uniref:uncharacterized protein LOC117218249 n=1 Tax=Megalopta genalis TaxID=115081 RepID=UPI003FD4AAE9
MHVKMETINLSILLIVIAYNVFPIWAFDDNMPYCFQFRWVPPIFNNTPARYNCTGQHDIIPCIEPPFIQDNFPNTSEIWLNRDEDDSTLCRLSVGFVCIRYILKVDNKIEKASLYCGKLVVDGLASSEPGCYQHNQNGSLIEVCACETGNGLEPCNVSSTISSNFVSLIILLFTLMYINC